MNTSTETILALTECNLTSQPDHKPTNFDLAMYRTNFVLGLPVHSYILWLITKGLGRGFASEIFILNISIFEILFCVRSLLTSLASEFSKLREIAVFLTGNIITGRFFQCLICVERYLAVVHPVTFLKYNCFRYRLACSISTWIANLFSCVFCLRFVNPCFNRQFACFYLAQLSVFLAINLFCCLAVLRALKQSGPGEKKKDEENHMKRRAFYVILLTTVSLILAYLPSIFMSLRYLSLISPLPGLDSLCLVLFLMASFVHPLHFFHRVGKLPLSKFSAGS